jgi:hypothetical protein
VSCIWLFKTFQPPILEPFSSIMGLLSKTLVVLTFCFRPKLTNPYRGSPRSEDPRRIVRTKQTRDEDPRCHCEDPSGNAKGWRSSKDRPMARILEHHTSRITERTPYDDTNNTTEAKPR